VLRITGATLSTLVALASGLTVLPGLLAAQDRPHSTASERCALLLLLMGQVISLSKYTGSGCSTGFEANIALTCNSTCPHWSWYPLFESQIQVTIPALHFTSSWGSRANRRPVSNAPTICKH
jgi:hypothetical protein